MSSPYASAASAYWEAGWRGVLPLPANKKTPPPDDYTGAHGIWPSWADVMAWTEDLPDANIGLRLPPDVIGIDVDTYDGKQGVATIQAAIRRFGDLPDTWLSTSRDPDTFSAIRLYRVPTGLRWPGQVGPDVEIIQTRHRYMVAPPSLHPTGRIYQWYAPRAELPIPSRPAPSDLPYLPSAWVEGLTSGAAEVDFQKGEASSTDVAAFLGTPAGAGQPCRITLARLDRLLRDLTTAGSRHDIALRGVMAFAHLASEGHRGTTYALYQFYGVWRDSVTSGAGARTPAEAAAEWDRMLSGAVGWAITHPTMPTDPCEDPFAGILPPDVRGDATLPGPEHETATRQGGAAPPPIVPAPGAPPGQGDGGTLPPSWVTAAPPGDSDASMISKDIWDKRSVAVALELERLEVRRDARLELVRADHMRTWREPPSYSLREMLALPEEPMQWRVTDVMPAGSNVLLTAQYKTGKTTLINELTSALVDGHEFLGTYKVHDDARVALFNYEVGQAQYGRWLRDREIANADSVHVFNLRGFTLPLSVPLVRDHIIEWLRARSISVWIVDPFARAFAGGNENENSEVSPFLEILDQIKEESGVTELVMPTHTGRAEFAVGQERARGATRLDDWCDVRWLLTKDDEGARYFRASGRDVETEETKLEYDPLTRALTLGEGARPRGSGRAGYGRHNAAQGVEDAVLEVVADEPGASQRQLRTEMRLRGVQARNTAVADAVRRLAQQGRVRVEMVPLGNGKTMSRHWPTGDAVDSGDS